MALEPRPALSERAQFLDREVAELGEKSVLDGCGVTLTHHEAITIGPIGLGRAHVEYVIVQRGKYLGSREHGSDV